MDQAEMKERTSEALRILILEDVPADAEMIERELKNNGTAFSLNCVYNIDDFLKQLAAFSPDIILSDYSMPQFNGMEALELVKALYSSIPFIIVTGSINEATAVECMKAGANDYVLKEDLKHIGPAVEGALEKKRLKEEKEKAEEIGRQSAWEWQTIFDSVNDAISLINMEGKILQCNKAMASLLDKPVHEVLGSTCWELVHNTSEPIEGCPFIRMRETHRRETMRLPSGDRMLQVTVDPVLGEDGDLISIVHIISDITALNRAEEQQKNLISELQNALAEVKKLSGFLPICASCKKIRDDKGYWNQIENYIRDHSEADFSHGICPECAKNLYPGLELSFKGNDS